MQDWNPDLYRQFEAERTRPAHELLARIGRQSAQQITDLGCGPANSTELLAHRFPQATITGIDNSSSMLENARQRLPGCHFLAADISQWQASCSQDIIYANASLQWVPNHEQLLPQLMKQLTAGGTLAIQVPDSREQPIHRLAREVAAREPWQALIDVAASTQNRILSADRYYDVLAPYAPYIDIWHTTYFHVLPSSQAVVEWIHSTGLRPYLAPLNPAQQQEFLQQYQVEIDRAYPSRSDGNVLLAFPRLFIVARRAG